MRRNQSSGATELRAKLARGSAGFGAGPNKRDFSGFGGSRNVENPQVYRHLHRLPFSKNPLCTAFQVEYWEDFLLDFDTVS